VGLPHSPPIANAVKLPIREKTTTLLTCCINYCFITSY
jgi:hypothetical protein